MICGALFNNPAGLGSMTGLDARLLRGGWNHSFHQVRVGKFTGGYFTHPGLPYSRKDIYYSDKVNDIVVLMYGSVYNRAELKEYFNRSDMPDPEGVAMMFLKEHEQFAAKLNGDFALFIYRPLRDEAYLFRDHVGIKPLAWTKRNDSLLFSSDAVGLGSFYSRGRVTEPEYILGWFKYIDYRKCPERQIHKLLPGHYLKIDGAGTELASYWAPGSIRTDKKLSYGDMMSDLGFLLRDSVKIRCDARFNAGSHVSGGIDSGIVASLARSHYKHQNEFYGFSWSPAITDGKKIGNDERELVDLTCRIAGIKTVYSDMDENVFIRTIRAFYNNQGYFEEHRTLEQAAGLNVNLLFSGWGGDEFISTGDRAIEIDLLRRLKLASFFRRNPVRPLRKFLRNQLEFVIRPLLGILGRSIRRSFSDDSRYLKRSFKKSDRRAIKNFYFHKSRRQLHLRYLEFYHLQERCESWAVNGFRHGVEYRYPLLDRRIIEYIMKIPTELLCQANQSRPLMRELGKGLVPEEVRLNSLKRDPAHSAYISRLFREAGNVLVHNAESWKKEPELSFVDYRLLEEDIQRLRAEPDEAGERVLYRFLVYLEAINSFCTGYAEQPERETCKSQLL